MIPMESPLNHPPANGRTPASQASKDGETQATLPASQGTDEMGKGFGLLVEGGTPEIRHGTSAPDDDTITTDTNTAETTDVPPKQHITPHPRGADNLLIDQAPNASIANEVVEIKPPLKPENGAKADNLPNAIDQLEPVSVNDQAKADPPQRLVINASATPDTPANFPEASIPLSPKIGGTEDTAQQPAPLPPAPPAKMVSPVATKAIEIDVSPAGLSPNSTAEKPPPSQRVDVTSNPENAVPARQQAAQVEVLAPALPPLSPPGKVHSPLDFVKIDGLEPVTRQAPEIMTPRADFTRAPAPPPIQDTRPIVTQLAAAIVKADSGKLDIRLDPPELGRLSVTISGADDAISAVVAADRAETQDLLRRHADLLQRVLRDAGYSEVKLDFSSSSQNSHGDGDGIGRNKNEAAPEPPTATELVTLRSPSSGLDIRL